MATPVNNKKNKLKNLLIAAAILLAGGIGTAWYIFTDTFANTATEKSAYTFNALDFIKEFQPNDSVANKRYAEQIITINGRVSETEKADTTVNIKMADANGSYIIFAFQQQDAVSAKALKQGDSVSIKGSCSGGIYSDILGTEFITFKRCTINQ